MLSLLYIVIIFVLSIIADQSPYSTKPTLSSYINKSLYQELPPDVHRLFNVTIIFPKFHTVNSALLVYLVNKTNTSYNLLETFMFRPGLQSRIKEPFTGKFISVPLCVSKSGKRIIELHIKFNLTTQNKTLLIYYSSDYQPQLKKINANLIYESVVSCKVSSKPNIKLFLGIGNINEPSFTSNQNIWINCSSKAEHEPKWRSVRLEGLDNFDILKQTLSNETKMYSVYTTASKKNHGSVIVCRSLNHFVSRKILIFHHPLSVLTIPKVNSWSKIPYNLSILCSAKGGYPPPIISWDLRIGPHNASQFYNLQNDKSILIMNKAAPPGSKWIFDCSAKNSIPSSNQYGPSLSVSFNVPEMTIESRKVVIIVVPIVVLILIVIISSMKRYCFHKEKKEKMEVSFIKQEKSRTLECKDKFLIDSQQTINSNNLSRKNSGSTYSIEAGIDHQTVFVLDESRQLNLHNISNNVSPL